MAESEIKLHDFLDKVVKQSERKGLASNCKKTECMSVKYRKKTRCKERIVDINVKHVE